MHPILFTLRLSPESARIAGIVVSVLLSAFIVWDGWRATHRAWEVPAEAGGRSQPKARAKLQLTILQAVLFLIGALAVCFLALTRDHLPDPVVLDIRSWGVFTIIGMCSCFLIQKHYGQKIGLSSEQILSLWVYGGVAAVIGARALHVIVNWSFYAKNPISALTFWDGGMVYIGSVTAALFVGILYAKKEKLTLSAFDVLALGVALTQGIGRIGCFLAGCCYGKETALPWGVRFPEGSIALFTMQQTGEVPETALFTPALHPTQLYEAIACFAVGILLLAWHRKGTAKPGAIIAAYFILYSAVRFVLELIRNDPERQFLFRVPEDAPLILSTSQVAGIVLAAAAAIFLWHIQKKPAPTPEVVELDQQPV